MKFLIFIAQYDYAKIILPCHEAGVFFTDNKNPSGEREYTGKEGFVHLHASTFILDDYLWNYHVNLNTQFWRY